MVVPKLSQVQARVVKIRRARQIVSFPLEEADGLSIPRGRR